jgi:hypothetical protein
MTGNVSQHSSVPIAELLKHQAVTREPNHQRAEQQAHADHPVQLARFAIRSGEEDSHLMQDD